jgi:serine/threonine protein phosphatase 1
MLLDSLLKLINFSDGDRLIVIGDMIDRGEDSLRTIGMIRALPSASVLLGNHEMMAIQYHAGEKSSWLKPKNGGSRNLEDLMAQGESAYVNAIEWFKTLPVKLLINQDRLLVHAGICPDVRIEEQSVRDMTWIRHDFFNKPTGIKPLVIFGHTPSLTKQGGGKNRVWFDSVNEDKLCIDCGAAYGGRLAAYCLDTDTAYYSDGESENLVFHPHKN